MNPFSLNFERRAKPCNISDAPVNARLLRSLLRHDALEGLLYNAEKLAKAAEEVAKAEAPAAHTDGVDEEVNEEVVGEDEDEEDAEVAPFLACFDVQRGEVVVSGGVLRRELASCEVAR